MQKLSDRFDQFKSALLEHSPRSKITGRNNKRLQHRLKEAMRISCRCSECKMDQADARTMVFSIPELLSMVFEYCLPEDDLPTDNPLAPPCLLTRVCRRWHDVALATPRLWARLDLVCFPSVPCGMLADRHFCILSDWLMRSGNYPTSIVLRYLGSSASDVRNISRILSALIPHAQRWRDISITAPMPCLRPILQLLGHATPALETCRITITSANAPSEREDLVLDWDNAIAFRVHPVTLDLRNSQGLKQLTMMTDALTDLICVDLPSSLQALTLNNFDLLLGPPGLRPNFCCANLRKLTLRSPITVSLLGQLAQSFPLLEDAFFNVKHGMDAESVTESNRSSIKFPKIQSLSLRAVSTGGGTDLRALGTCIGVLDVPALECLSLTVSHAVIQRIWSPLAEHLGRVSPSLKELSIVGAYFGANEFLAILRGAPELENLRICARLTDNVFSALTLPTNRSEESYTEQVFCPNLKCLDIPLPSQCYADPVIAMILSRCPPPSTGNTDQESSAIAKRADLCRPSLQECKLVLSEPGVIELIEHHPDIAKCIERGLRIDLRAF